jgi:hypothetical protein
MQELTEYPGPRQDDYDNVLALNTAYIDATSDLKGPQRGRLAAAPFLLFSLRENDLDWWRRALGDGRQQDLIEIPELDNPVLRCVQTAGLSFLWQLAQRNPYSVRIVSGATVAWCDLVSELPLLTLLDRIGARGDLIQSRLDAPNSIGTRLLGTGTSASATLRRSSQLSALQELLAGNATDSHARLSSAACNLSGPMRVIQKKV